MNTREEQLAMISDCEQHDTGLTAFEACFIDDVAHALDKAGCLSIKDDCMLESIWNRVNEDTIKCYYKT